MTTEYITSEPQCPAHGPAHLVPSTLFVWVLKPLPQSAFIGKDVSPQDFPSRELYLMYVLSDILYKLPIFLEHIHVKRRTSGEHVPMFS